MVERCTLCEKKAEFSVPSLPGVLLCEECALDYLKDPGCPRSESFLPRIKR